MKFTIDCKKVAKNESKLDDKYSISDIMHTWTRQMGHPVIYIQNIDNRRISIKQSHFLLDPSSKPISSPYKYNYILC